jgi:hypothetical protein
MLEGWVKTQELLDRALQSKLVLPAPLLPRLRGLTDLLACFDDALVAI